MSNDNIIRTNERRAAFMGLGLKLPHLLARVAPSKEVAVSMAADFFCEFLAARGELEPKDFPSSLKATIAEVPGRVEKWKDTNIPVEVHLPNWSLGKLKKEVEQISRDVATALLMEAKQENFDEFQFWREFFLGMADADPSGVVIVAARLVFLDHEEDFRKAFRLDAALAGAGTRH